MTQALNWCVTEFWRQLARTGVTASQTLDQVFEQVPKVFWPNIGDWTLFQGLVRSTLGRFCP